MVNQLLRSTKEAYYSKFIEENSTDSRKLFKSVNMILNRNLDACYPTAKSDTDLAGAFADFFMQKIDRIRSEIAVGRSTIESTTISEAVKCFSCETNLQSFKSLTNNEVFKLIKFGTIKSCSLDPLPASIMAKCCQALLPMLTRIINLSLATGEMPEDLKCAMLRPLLKKPTADHNWSLPTSAQSLILSISPNLLKKQSLYSLMTIGPVMIYMCPFSPHIGVVTAQSQL